MIVLPPDWSFEDEINTWPLLALDQLAHFPHEYNTFIGPGNTIQNPFPWSPSGMNGAVIGSQMLAPSEEAESLVHEGREIHFLGAWFLYQDEMQVKLDEGVDRFVDLCIEAGVSEVVDPDRPSFAPRKRRRFGLFGRR